MKDYLDVMKKSFFERKVLDKMPGFSSIDGFFYMVPFEHVLSGFFCEKTPKGAYLWKFIYPLFDRFECLSLLYSYRLPGDFSYVDFEYVPKRSLPEEFLSRISGYLDEPKKYLTLQQFHEYLVGRTTLLNHEHAELVLGYTETLLGQKDRAVFHLSNSATRLRKPFLDDCQLILKLIERDVEDAKEAVLGFESDMRNRLGI